MSRAGTNGRSGWSNSIFVSLCQHAKIRRCCRRISVRQQTSVCSYTYPFHPKFLSLGISWIDSDHSTRLNICNFQRLSIVWRQTKTGIPKDPCHHEHVSDFHPQRVKQETFTAFGYRHYMRRQLYLLHVPIPPIRHNGSHRRGPRRCRAERPGERRVHPETIR
jgi:hypothetical protein